MHIFSIVDSGAADRRFSKQSSLVTCILDRLKAGTVRA